MSTLEFTSPDPRTQRILAAIKELHEACYDAWNHDDDEAFAEAYRLSVEAKNQTGGLGDDIQGWSGGCLCQADAVEAGMGLLECYDADKKLRYQQDIEEA